MEILTNCEHKLVGIALLLYDTVQFVQANKNILFSSSDVTYGSCVQVEGEMVQSKGPNQAEELQATKLEVIGTCDREVSSVWNLLLNPIDIRSAVA